MIYAIISIVVPIGVFLVFPFILAQLTHKPAQRNIRLLAACVVYFISWYLPSPLIDGKNTAFTTHVIGGGVFSGVLWLYTKQHIRWHASLLVELISLFAFVSAFGVLNELFELLLVRLHAINLTLTDTSWDLLANTLGALLFWIGYWAFSKTKHV